MKQMKVLSLNVRGLHEGIKRRKVFRFLKRNKPNICMLQETHCTPEVQKIWEAEWGNKIVFANGDNKARGEVGP